MMSPAKRRLGIGLVGVALLSVPAIAQATPVHHQLESLGVLPATASFTEVYFSSPNPIHTAVKANGTTSFAYVVHNQSTSTRIYRMVVSSGLPGHLKQLEAKSLTLAGGAALSVPVHLKVASCKVRSEINVEVRDDSGKVESIHFWAIPDPTAPAAKAGSGRCAV
ncbi:MAG: hypothetical protein QOI76_3688 [Frankiales bacterium]|jgi:hypothetical protein|nr:hypothetical protein [Frankiales bacterium]